MIHIFVSIGLSRPLVSHEGYWRLVNLFFSLKIPITHNFTYREALTMVILGASFRYHIRKEFQLNNIAFVLPTKQLGIYKRTTQLRALQIATGLLRKKGKSEFCKKPSLQRVRNIVESPLFDVSLGLISC
ncbi:unnamed protein product [Ilex paraguariensis]|uniref:Uncharacterized protein n=1 Tax=Ilex paraguariensis TaxID=185542 RepID=A0ABC8TDH4_9AQUA